MFNRRPTSSSGAAAAVEDSPVEGEALWAPAQARTRKTTEQLLLERGQITEEQLEQARKVQSQTPGKTLAQILLTMNAASEAQILSAQAETLGLAFETPDKSEIDARAFAM